MEMHALLSSALESSSKNNDKYNTLKEKLVDSQNLVSALTKKVVDFFIFLHCKVPILSINIIISVYLYIYLEF